MQPLHHCSDFTCSPKAGMAGHCCGQRCGQVNGHLITKPTWCMESPTRLLFVTVFKLSFRHLSVSHCIAAYHQLYCTVQYVSMFSGFCCSARRRRISLAGGCQPINTSSPPPSPQRRQRPFGSHSTHSPISIHLIILPSCGERAWKPSSCTYLHTLHIVICMHHFTHGPISILSTRSPGKMSLITPLSSANAIGT